MAIAPDMDLVLRARRLLEGARDELDGAKLRSEREVRGLLALLDEEAQTGRAAQHREAVRRVLEVLSSPETEEAARIYVTEAPAVLDRLARAVIDDDRFRDEVLRALVSIPTEEAWARWVERILADLPGEGVGPRSFLAVYHEPLHPGVLFPRLLEGLSDPAKRFAIVALANACYRSGGVESHPLSDHEEVVRLMLDEFLGGTGGEDDAYEATIALAHVASVRGRETLERALGRAQPRIRLEAARALALRGDRRGVRALEEACLSHATLERARAYLEELGHDHLVPEETKHPDERALAQFADWLSDPRELGRPPDELEIVERRTLAWPPSGEPRRVRLVRYRASDPWGLAPDEVGAGIVGAVPWCLHAEELAQLPPEDAYAIYCAWDLEQAGLLVEDGDSPPEILAGLAALPLSGAVLRRAVRPAPELRYPSPLVGLFEARRGGEPGWAVADGGDVAWYPRADFPRGLFDSSILAIHVGRRLLGLVEPVDRRLFHREVPVRPDGEVVSAYERIVAEVEERWPAWGPDLRQRLAILSTHLHAYAGACVRQGRHARADEALVEVARRFLRWADSAADPEVRAMILERSAGPFFYGFEEIAQAFLALDRRDEAEILLDALEPSWDHNLGRARLGSLAFSLGLLDRAERLLLALRDGLRDFGRAVELDLLARIWCAQGCPDEARGLLLACLSQLRDPADEAAYQHHRQTHIELFGAQEPEFEALRPSLLPGPGS